MEKLARLRPAFPKDAPDGIETLVVTGPTDEILKFFDAADTMDGLVLAVDFYNWLRPVCGG